MKYLNLKIQNQLIIFSLIFLTSRIDNLIFFNKLNLVIDPNYKLAINDFFLEYIQSQHVSPLGKLLFDKIVFFSSDLIGVKIQLLFYLFNIITTFFFFFFIIVYLNKSFKRKTITRLILYIFTISLSIFFDSYELWRPHYHDHLTFFLIALLSILLIYKDNFENYLSLYFIFALLILSYTLGITISVITISFILIFQYLNNKSIKIHINYFSLILLLFFLLSLKNYYNVNIFSPSSNGGANLIQRTIHSIGNENYYNLINNELNLPNWFKVCNNNIFEKNQKLQLINNDNFQSKLAHGLCFLDGKNQINFTNYKKAISKNSQNIEFISKVEKDEFNLRNKKWLFSGVHDELTFISTVEYTSYGTEIFFQSLKRHPKQMIIGKIGNKGILLTFLKMVSYGGLFPDYYENFSYPKRNKFANYFYNILILLVIIINLSTPYIFYKKTKKALIKKKIDFKDLTYFIFVSIALIQIVLTSTITCCENPRITVIYFPIIFMILLLNIEYILKKK